MTERGKELSLSQISEVEDLRFSVLKRYLRNDSVLQIAELMEKNAAY